MSTDKTLEDQATEAGAVELDETRLGDASGGLLPAVQTELKINAVLGDGSVRPTDVNGSFADGSVRFVK